MAGRRKEEENLGWMPIPRVERKVPKVVRECAKRFGRYDGDLIKTKLSLDQFRTAVRTGAFKTICLRACGVCFLIAGEPRLRRPNSATDGQWLTLATTRDRGDRMFRDPWTALALLWEMGASEVKVDMEAWDPVRVANRSRKRPDMAERLKRAHAVGRLEKLG